MHNLNDRRQPYRVCMAASLDALGTLRLPKVLAEAGCRVTLVSPPGMAVSQSRFVSGRIITGSGAASVAAALPGRLAGTPAYDWVLIADEPLIRAMVRNATEYTPACLAASLPASLSALRRILSKIDFLVDAQSAGVAAPPFQVLAEGELSRYPWPGRIIVKAEESISGSGVRLVHNQDEWRKVQREFQAGPVLLQEYMTGRVGATSILYDHGVPRCWYSYLLARNWPTPLASASAMEPVWHGDLEDIVTRIGGMTQFHGLCGLDWVIDPQGKPLILEMNPRPTPGVHLAHHGGVSFSKGIDAWLAGRELVQPPVSRNGKLVRMFPQNLFRSLDDRNPIEFLRTWGDAPWTDPALLGANVRRVASHYLPTSLRNRLRDLKTG